MKTHHAREREAGPEVTYRKLLADIVAVLFTHSDKCAVMIGNEIVEAVRVNEDFLICKYGEK